MSVTQQVPRLSQGWTSLHQEPQCPRCSGQQWGPEAPEDAGCQWEMGWVS